MNEDNNKVSSDKGNVQILTKLFLGFKSSLIFPKADKPRTFLESMGLDFNQIEVGFNSGQFHHRKTEEFRKPYIEMGVLKKSNGPVNAPDRTPYKVFGKYSVVFPLKNIAGDIVNLYAYRFKIATPTGEHLNEQGVYPYYPNPKTTRLYICSDELETATLIQTGLLENRDSVLALREGKITQPITDAIEQIEDLQEIILLGKGECDLPNLKVIEFPEDHSLNDMWVNYDADAIQTHIEEQLEALDQGQEPTKELQVISDKEFMYVGQELNYQVLGEIPTNATLLEMQFEIRNLQDGSVIRCKLDLLDTVKVKGAIFNYSEGRDLNYAQAIIELNFITEELQKLRRLQEQGEPLTHKGFSTKLDKQAKKLLKSENLFEELNKLIGEAGVIGEENTRLLLYMIASSYKHKYNLHAVIQSENIETGSELVNKIAGLIPEKEQYEIDLTTSRTFRYYGNAVINNMLLVIPDYSGVTSSRAIKDLKRLQAKGRILHDAPKKGDSGLLSTIQDVKNGHTSSIGACTQTKRYFENEPRTVLVGTDTSQEQLEKLMEHDCRMMAGMIDQKKEVKAKELLQYIVKNVFAQEVVNPYASSLMLPTSIPNARMLTMQLLNFVNLTTLFKQHQRKRDGQGKLLTTPEDVKTAIDLFLDAIMINIDELDSTVRDFYEKLKPVVEKGKQGRKTPFTALEIKETLQISKSNVNRNLSVLLKHEYIKKEGHKNQGFKYEVTNWNELNAVKQMIQNKLGDHSDPKQMSH